MMYFDESDMPISRDAFKIDRENYFKQKIEKIKTLEPMQQFFALQSLSAEVVLYPRKQSYDIGAGGFAMIGNKIIGYGRIEPPKGKRYD